MNAHKNIFLLQEDPAPKEFENNLWVKNVTHARI